MPEELSQQRKKSFYTVSQNKNGFFVSFKCVYCDKLHSFPENAEQETFQDPGDASQEFQAYFKMCEWEYITAEKLLGLCYGG